MEIKGDVVRISTIGQAPDGSKIDPEEHLAEHVIDLGAPLSLGGQSVGQIKGSFDYQTTAGEIAVALRDRCGDCKHWDVPRWRKLRRTLEYSSDMTQRQFVNEIRFTLEQMLPEGERERHLDNQGELDLDHALDSMGICNVLTEILSRSHGQLHPVIQLANGGCPDHKGPKGEVLSGYFTPRDNGAKKNSAAVYDKILNAARGKT